MSLFEFNMMYVTPLLFLGGAFVFVSKIPRAFVLWKTRDLSKDFGVFAGFVAGSILLGTFSFIIYLSWAMQFLTKFGESYSESFLTLPAILLMYLVVPGIHAFFRKFQHTKKDYFFCLSVLMVFIALFVFSVLFSIMLNSLDYWILP